MTKSTVLMLSVAMIAALTVEVQAAIPQVNAVCPQKIEVHADEGGPVYINGKEAKLKVFNANYYEATLGKVTIELMINPDGTAAVSYNVRGGGNGVCTVS